jgi:hypothetical protein
MSGKSPLAPPKAKSTEVSPRGSPRVSPRDSPRGSHLELKVSPAAPHKTTTMSNPAGTLHTDEVLKSWEVRGLKMVTWKFSKGKVLGRHDGSWADGAALA